MTTIELKTAKKSTVRKFRCEGCYETFIVPSKSTYTNNRTCLCKTHNKHFFGPYNATTKQLTVVTNVE